MYNLNQIYDFKEDFDGVQSESRISNQDFVKEEKPESLGEISDPSFDVKTSMAEIDSDEDYPLSKRSKHQKRRKIRAENEKSKEEVWS